MRSHYFLLDKLIEITNEGFSSVKLLPKTIKKYSNEAYSCILEVAVKKANKPYLESLDIDDFENNNLSVKIEFMSSIKNIF